MKNQLLVPSITSWAAPSIFDTIRQFLVFLRKPRHQKTATVPKEKRLQVLIQLNLTAILVKALIIAAVGFLYHLFDINLHQVNLHKITGDKSFYLVLLMVAVYGPVREELTFRLPLMYSRRFMLIALGAFLVGYAPLVIQEANLGTTLYAVAALALCTFAAVLLFSPRLHDCIRQPWRTDFAGLYYLVTLVFALQYLVNYPYVNLPVFMLPVLVLLQWVEGLFLGYTRLHLGLKWSLAQHIFNKTLLFTVFFSVYSST